MNFKNKHICVIGLGKSGFAASRFLHHHGANVRVTDSSDKKEVLENADFLKNLGVLVETGGHSETFVKKSDLIITSPGVSKSSLPLQIAAKIKIPVISEIELASYFCKGRKVAVTGSNGKTTTCHLIDRIIRDAGRKSALCGNVGYSFLEAVPSIDKKTTAVIELSSFQLEDSPTFRPQVAVVLNVSRNHLDRHGSMEAYIKAKEAIFRNQRKTDCLILNYNDAIVNQMAQKTRSQVIFFSKQPISNGVFARNGQIVFRKNNQEKILLNYGRLKLKGDHNLENVLAAVTVAIVLKLPMRSVQKTINSFETLEHRIESIGTLGDVHFINDSKSTTVESTVAAIKAIDGPVILIAGGRNKGALFNEIEPLLNQKVKQAVLYGESREAIASSWKSYKKYHMESDFRKAVRTAYSLAEKGDSILLSPMCTSFDQFSCFEERGEVFKDEFANLKRLFDSLHSDHLNEASVTIAARSSMR